MYIYFQPNEKDKKGKYGDCSVRAICKAENITWLEAYDLMCKYSREIQCPFNVKEGFEYILKNLGYKYHSIGRPKKGEKRPTVKTFAMEHNKGIYLPIVASHYVCIKDGDWYDSWDSYDCCVYGYWEK